MSNQDNIKTIIKYLPPAQRMAFMQGLQGSGRNYYEEIADNIANVVSSAPAIYGTDGLNADEIKPVLHYFWNNIDIYVVEIDTSGCNQHYGYTSLSLGCFESGYIELDYIFNELPLLNLDLHFTPDTISDYKRKYEG